MKSPCVREIEPGKVATGTFLVQSKEVRQKKTGEPYLSLVLGDRTGELDAKMWDNVAEVMNTFERDDYVRVKGLLHELDLGGVQQLEHDLLAYATEKILTIPGVSIIGTAAQKAAVLSFTMEGIHPHDIGTILDVEGVAIRTGHHCAQPVMQFFGVPATARASFAFYNTKEEVDAFIKALHKVIEVLG